MSASWKNMRALDSFGASMAAPLIEIPRTRSMDVATRVNAAPGFRMPITSQDARRILNSVGGDEDAAVDALLTSDISRVRTKFPVGSMMSANLSIGAAVLRSSIVSGAYHRVQEVDTCAYDSAEGVDLCSQPDGILSTHTSY